jgi:hypothetical protein
MDSYTTFILLLNKEILINCFYLLMESLLYKQLRSHSLLCFYTPTDFLKILEYANILNKSLIHLYYYLINCYY